MENEPEIFGRRQELDELKRSLKEGKHILLCGESGSGKTMLVRELLRQMAKRNPSRKIVYISQSVSLKQTCLKIARQLHLSAPDIENLKAIALKNFVLKSLREGNYILVFDHLDKLKFRFYLFLDALRDHSKLILIPKNSDIKTMGRLWMMLWGFKTLKLNGLHPKDSKELVCYCLRSAPNLFNDKIIHEICNIAKGNPGHITALCNQLCLENAGTNPRMADIDLQISEYLKKRDILKPCRS